MVEFKESECAKEVYVLLNEKYRVSRYYRLKWYVDNLFKPLVPSEYVNCVNEDDDSLRVISVVPVLLKLRDADSNSTNLHLSTNTKVVFLSRAYKFVFGIDLSSSVLRVDTLKHYVVIESILTSLEKCLLSLLQDCSCGNFAIKPNIYVTIFAQWHGTEPAEAGCGLNEKLTQKVLIQGCLLTMESVKEIMAQVKDCIYTCAYNNSQAKMHAKQDDILLSILRTSLLALRVLPPNCSSSIVIITDGVVGEPNDANLERVLKQCQSTTTACSFLHVCSSSNPLCDFGSLSNVELMKFISKSTKGKYINSLLIPVPPFPFFQNALLPWTLHSQRDLTTDISALILESDKSCSAFDLRNVIAENRVSPELIRRKQHDRSVVTDFLTVVSARLREGFVIKSTHVGKNSIEMCLELLWWKNGTTVEYKVSSTWPLSLSRCKVEVYIHGTYEFLLDVSRSHESRHWTRYRKLIMHRFKMFFQNLMQSDHMLQNLQSFTDDQDRYCISDSLRQGQTLYYLPPNSSQFELSTQFQQTTNAFSSYWKPVLSLDVNVWHKWFNIHKIEAILQHDVPLPNNLHAISNNGRYHSVQCRKAATLIATMLREWCTFVLLENHTYVKFIYDSSNSETPASFFLVRLFSKSPAMILKVAFLSGLSGKVRKLHVDELRERIAALVVSISGVSSNSTSSKRVRHTSSKLSPVMRTHRTPLSASDLPCAILLHKPMDQFLVKYLQPPDDYHTNAISLEDKVKVSSDMNDQYVRMRDMQWYLRHHRSVWSLTNSTLTQLSLHVACDLSSLLQKIRMEEGFHITYSSSGVVNLAREFPMYPSHESAESVTDYCLVQYVIFPPKMQSTNSINSSSSLESDDDGSEEDTIGNKEILFVSEVWVEPQHGRVKENGLLINSASGSDHLDNFTDFQSNLLKDVTHYAGLSCDEIIQHINKLDFVCISNVTTLEHLQLMCSLENDMTSYAFPQRQSSPPNDVESIGASVSSRDVRFTADSLSENGNSLPLNAVDTKDFNYASCVFDFTCLLDHSPRITHLFMTLAEDEACPAFANMVLLEDYHKSLSSYCDCCVDLSDEDQKAITQHMIEKSLKLEHLDEVCNSDAQDWSCYLKTGENGQVFVVLLPATYQSFLKLAFLFEEKVTLESQESYSNTFCSSTLLESDVKNFGEAPDFRETPSEISFDGAIGTASPRSQRRMSIKRLASTASNNSENFLQRIPAAVSQRTFSVFVYNCSMKMLVSSLLHGAKNTSRIKWPDSLQDHRLCVDSSADEYFPAFSSQKQSASFVKPSLSPHGLGDISDDAYPLRSSESNVFSYFNISITDLYHRSFVVGIFSAVQSEDKVYFSTDDLQIATDYFCHESVDEIDITDFMFLNSPQIMEFKSKNSHPNVLTGIKIDAQDGASLSSDNDAVASDKKNHSSAPIRVRQIRKKKFTSIGSSDLQTDFSLHKPDLKNVDSKDQKSEDKDRSYDSADSDSVWNGPTPTFPSISFHKDSAFTSVRTYQSQKKKIVEGSDESTTSDEEVGLYNSKRNSASVDKKGTTLPVKQIIKDGQHAGGLQAGWNNLPEFPLSLLNIAHSRHFSGTNEQVEKHFLKFLKAHCQGVRGVPYLFYAVNKSISSRKLVSETEVHKTDSDLEVQFICESDTAVRQTTSFNESEGTPAPLVMPDFEVTSPTDCADDKSSDIFENVSYVTPLFLYMACTIRDTTTGHVGTVPVRCLPLNLKNVVDSLEVPSNSIKLSNVKITLDLIWIFLPSSSDSLTVKVPDECSAFVRDIKHKIEWILEDEIVSSLRTTEPINVSTLERVANHVKGSSSSNVKVSSVPLQFIFGVDRSCALLHSEFEKFRIDNYKLKKENHYYFLSLERSFIPIFDRFNSIEKVAANQSVEHDGESVQSEATDNPVTSQPTFTKLFSVKAMGDSLVSLSTKNKLGLEPNHSNTASSLEISLNQNDKNLRKLTKASSSNELVKGSSGVARRCTSASNMQFAMTSVNEAGHSGSLSFVDKVEISNLVTPPPVLSHHGLRTSLSLGKEPKYFSPVNSNRGRVVSMPVTPSGVVNLTTEMFVFPSAISDSRQNIGASPVSDASNHHCSQPSWFGSGYEGEESDSGDEYEFRNSLQEAYSQLPNFWLIVNFSNACATVYFHRRSSTRVLSAVKMEHARIFDLVTSNLQKSCKAVNQTLLLKQLQNSLWCHPLLVEESPEDIWRKNDYSNVYQHTDSVEDHIVYDVPMASSSSDYLAANMNFPPGHFECKCVLEQFIFLHHRIISSKSASGGTIPSALSTVNSKMKNFTVINQKHMFVFSVQDGTIYYCKMREDIKRPDSSGRRSSLMLTDAEHSSQNKDSSQRFQENDSKLLLKWFGVHDLTQQHLNELQELRMGIEKKLDDTVLEYITLMLCRNSQFKLTAADVRLIQPREVNADGYLLPALPDETVSFAVSSHLAVSMPALLYYIHQHLLLFLGIPRYTGPDLVQFLPIHSKEFTSVSSKMESPALYLYAESKEKGKKGHGVACICLDYCKKEPNCDSQPLQFDINTTVDGLRELATTTQIHASTSSDSVISLYIWTRGSLNTKSLHSKLEAALHHAMSDAVTERSLEMPFTYPTAVKTNAMKPLFERSEKEDSRFLQNFFQTKFGSGPTSRSMSRKEVVADEQISAGTSLNRFYASVLPHWLLHMIDISSPSVSFSCFRCPGKLNTEQVVNNMSKILSSALSDSRLLKFGKTLDSANDWYCIDGDVVDTLDPGMYMQFVLLSRNFDLWKKSIKANGSSLIKVNTSIMSLQKFPPHDVTLKPEASPCPQHDMMMSSPYIPRQHLAYVFARNNSFEVYLYNVAPEKSQVILQQLEQCTRFHTARHNMLQGLTFQKLGLFRHYLTKQGKSDEQNPIDLGQYPVDVLTRYNSLAHAEKRPRYSFVDKCFDEFLLNVPSTDNIETSSKQIKDKVSLYGQQCFKRLKQKSSLREAQSQLKNLRRKSSGSFCSVSSSELRTILSFARVYHSETSPIMLDDLTRQTHVSFFTSGSFRRKDEKSEKGSTVLSRTSSFLGSYRRRSGESLSKMPEKDSQNLFSRDGSSDLLEISFDFVAKKFVELYSDHWKGFVKLQASDLPKLSKRKHIESEENYDNVHYRYRFLQGGIILIAFSVQQHCFEVKLYTITASTFSDESGVFPSKTHVNFVDECEKVKKNLFVHRISLDVHLRYVQWYLNESQHVLKAKCYLRDLLRSLVIAYSPVLDNIQSQIYHDTVSHTCTQVSCQDLYKFIVANASAFKLKTCVQSEKVDASESILYTENLSTDHADCCSSVVRGNCSFCQIIFKDADHESNALKLHYYLLFFVNGVSRLPIYANKRLPESLVKASASLSRRLSEASISLPSSSSANFLPKTELKSMFPDEVLENVADLTADVPSYVVREKIHVEKNLRELAYTATMECYRSCNLWQKLVHVCQEKIYAKTFSFTEFSTLLKMMYSCSASEYDSKISQLFEKRNVKQDSFIIKRLHKMFPKYSTVVISPDGIIHRACILSPRSVHAMIIVKLDTQSNELELFVVKPLLEHYIFHEYSADDACKELLQKVCNAIATSIWMSWL